MDAPFLYYLSEFFIFSGIIIAAVFLWLLHRRPPAMKIMNAVWVLTGLWAHFFALAAYFKFGRSRFVPHRKSKENKSRICDCGNAQDKMYEYMRIGRMMEEEMTGDTTDDLESEALIDDRNRENMGGVRNMDMRRTDIRNNGHPENGGEASKNGDMKMEMSPARSRWESVALSTLHCGAGCTLGDIVGEWFAYKVPIYIGGSFLAGRWTLDFILALLFGVFFQFSAIRQMEAVPVARALKRALKADFLSLASWQIGMYGWMAVVHFVLFKNTVINADTWIFWFMMQIAMFFGFFFSYPMNSLLLRWGIKKGM